MYTDSTVMPKAPKKSTKHVQSQRITDFITTPSRDIQTSNPSSKEENMDNESRVISQVQKMMQTVFKHNHFKSKLQEMAVETVTEGTVIGLSIGQSTAVNQNPLLTNQIDEVAACKLCITNMHHSVPLSLTRLISRMSISFLFSNNYDSSQNCNLHVISDSLDINPICEKCNSNHQHASFTLCYHRYCSAAN